MPESANEAAADETTEPERSGCSPVPVFLILFHRVLIVLSSFAGAVLVLALAAVAALLSFHGGATITAQLRFYAAGGPWDLVWPALVLGAAAAAGGFLLFGLTVKLWSWVFFPVARFVRWNLRRIADLRGH